jgi:hypothetical protein
MDIEGLIFSLANIDSISIGIYENMRRFNLEYYKEKDDKGHGSPPNQRIYSNKLLQWIDFDYIGALKDIENFLDLFENNKPNITNSDFIYNVIKDAKSEVVTTQSSLVELTEYATVLYTLNEATDIDDVTALFYEDYYDDVFTYTPDLGGLFNNEQYSLLKTDKSTEPLLKYEKYIIDWFINKYGNGYEEHKNR